MERKFAESLLPDVSHFAQIRQLPFSQIPLHDLRFIPSSLVVRLKTSEIISVITPNLNMRNTTKPYLSLDLQSIYLRKKQHIIGYLVFERPM